MEKDTLVEIARSFAQTVQVEQFAPRNFFCSMKAEVPFEQAEEASKELYHFCRMQVERDMSNYLKEKEQEQFINIEDVGKPTKPLPPLAKSDSDTILEKLKNHVKYKKKEPTYTATERYPDGTSNKVLVDKDNDIFKDAIIH